jgi:hypothetical protein
VKRRQFLSGGVAATASGLGVAGNLIQGAALDASGRALVVVQDVRIQLDPDTMRRLFISELPIVALTTDPVRLWRSDAGELLRRPETRLLGVTGWADFLMVRGLAAETRRHVRQQRHDPRTGTFTWLIA